MLPRVVPKEKFSTFLCGSFIEAKGPARAPRSYRFNAHHDKVGKFATANGGGGWTHQSAVDIRAANLASWEKEAGRTFTPDEMAALEEYLSPGDVRQRLTKGRATIDVRDDGVPREALNRLTSHIDALQSVYPITTDNGRLQINIRPVSFMEKGTHATTVRGQGFMNVSSEVLTNAEWDSPHLMPSAATTDRLTYVMTHEWGHATHTDQSDGLLWAKHFTDMSTYGTESPAESHAEAFAEWVLTRGQTKNPAAIEYAQKHGWGVLP